MSEFLFYSFSLCVSMIVFMLGKVVADGLWLCDVVGLCQCTGNVVKVFFAREGGFHRHCHRSLYGTTSLFLRVRNRVRIN